MSAAAGPGPQMRYDVEESTTIPWTSLVLGYGAMLPFIGGTTLAALALPPSRAFWIEATLVWGGAILAFLGGVRRGLSFRAPHPDSLGALASMLWLFGLAGLSLLLRTGPAAALLLLLGYLSTAVLDWRAARRRDVPPYFGRLRPLQMLIPVACLMGLAVLQWPWPML